MMRPTVRGLLGCLLLSMLAVTHAHACRQGAFSLAPRASSAFFVGRATPDTLFAGPGDVRHYYNLRAPDREEVYGQLVEIDGIGGPGFPSLQAKPARVVVVPWHYNTACHPVRYGGTARWVTPGVTAFFMAELRPREHWVGEIPTLDLFNTSHYPYTGSEPISGIQRGQPVEDLLTPDEVFGLYLALPSDPQVRAGDRSFEAGLSGWIAENGHLATRPPAEDLIRDAHSLAAYVESLANAVKFGPQQPIDTLAGLRVGTARADVESRLAREGSTLECREDLRWSCKLYVREASDDPLVHANFLPRDTLRQISVETTIAAADVPVDSIRRHYSRLGRPAIEGAYWHTAGHLEDTR